MTDTLVDISGASKDCRGLRPLRVERLAIVDRFGIVNKRVVLLEMLSIVQNLWLPLTVEIESPPDNVRARAVSLAQEVGLAAALWERPVGELDLTARALAYGPAVLLLEHASASVPPADVVTFAATVRAIAADRSLAIIATAADNAFAGAVAPRVLTLEAAAGRLTPRRQGWFGRRQEPGSVCPQGT